MLGPGNRGQAADVGHQRGPAARAEITRVARDGGGAVTAVVLGVGDVPGRGQCLRDVVIPSGVFAHAVGDLYDRARGPAGSQR